jgi:hypothetical protein
MLILDKQKAVERVMALTTTASTVAEPEPPPVRGRRRNVQRVATYERRPGPPETVAPPATEPKVRRRRGPAISPLPA